MFCINQIVYFEFKTCGFISSKAAAFYQKRSAGFQPSSSGLPMEVKLRMIERKKKKVEKLSKQPLNYIPIVDFYIPYSWKQTTHKRKLPTLSEEASDERILLEKKWKSYINDLQKKMEYRLQQSLQEQEKALMELQKESTELYEEALKCVDIDELQFSCRGPVQTMPIVEYLPPLGGFIEKEPPFNTDEITMPDY